MARGFETTTDDTLQHDYYTNEFTDITTALTLNNILTTRPVTETTVYYQENETGVPSTSLAENKLTEENTENSNIISSPKLDTADKTVQFYEGSKENTTPYYDDNLTTGETIQILNSAINNATEIIEVKTESQKNIGTFSSEISNFTTTLSKNIEVNTENYYSTSKITKIYTTKDQNDDSKLDFDELVQSSSTIHVESTVKPNLKHNATVGMPTPSSDNKNTKTPDNQRQLNNNFTGIITLTHNDDHLSTIEQSKVITVRYNSQPSSTSSTLDSSTETLTSKTEPTFNDYEFTKPSLNREAATQVFSLLPREYDQTTKIETKSDKTFTSINIDKTTTSINIDTIPAEDEQGTKLFNPVSFDPILPDLTNTIDSFSISSTPNQNTNTLSQIEMISTIAYETTTEIADSFSSNLDQYSSRSTISESKSESDEMTPTTVSEISTRKDSYNSESYYTSSAILGLQTMTDFIKTTPKTESTTGTDSIKIKSDQIISDISAPEIETKSFETISTTAIELATETISFHTTPTHSVSGVSVSQTEMEFIRTKSTSGTKSVEIIPVTLTESTTESNGIRTETEFDQLNTIKEFIETVPTTYTERTTVTDSFNTSPNKYPSATESIYGTNTFSAESDHSTSGILTSNISTESIENIAVTYPTEPTKSIHTKWDQLTTLTEPVGKLPTTVFETTIATDKIKSKQSISNDITSQGPESIETMSTTESEAITEIHAIRNKSDQVLSDVPLPTTQSEYVESTLTTIIETNTFKNKSGQSTTRFDNIEMFQTSTDAQIDHTPDEHVSTEREFEFYETTVTEPTRNSDSNSTKSDQLFNKMSPTPDIKPTTNFNNIGTSTELNQLSDETTISKLYLETVESTFNGSYNTVTVSQIENDVFTSNQTIVNESLSTEQLSTQSNRLPNGVTISDVNNKSFEIIPTTETDSTTETVGFSTDTEYASSGLTKTEVETIKSTVTEQTDMINSYTTKSDHFFNEMTTSVTPSSDTIRLNNLSTVTEFDDISNKTITAQSFETVESTSDYSYNRITVSQIDNEAMTHAFVTGSLSTDTEKLSTKSDHMPSGVKISDDKTKSVETISTTDTESTTVRTESDHISNGVQILQTTDSLHTITNTVTESGLFKKIEGEKSWQTTISQTEPNELTTELEKFSTSDQTYQSHTVTFLQSETESEEDQPITVTESFRIDRFGDKPDERVTITQVTSTENPKVTEPSVESETAKNIPDSNLMATGATLKYDHIEIIPKITTESSKFSQTQAKTVTISGTLTDFNHLENFGVTTESDQFYSGISITNPEINIVTAKNTESEITEMVLTTVIDSVIEVKQTSGTNVESGLSTTTETTDTTESTNFSQTLANTVTIPRTSTDSAQWTNLRTTPGSDQTYGGKFNSHTEQNILTSSITEKESTINTTPDINIATVSFTERKSTESKTTEIVLTTETDLEVNQTSGTNLGSGLSTTTVNTDVTKSTDYSKTLANIVTIPGTLTDSAQWTNLRTTSGLDQTYSGTFNSNTDKYILTSSTTESTIDDSTNLSTESYQSYNEWTVLSTDTDVDMSTSTIENNGLTDIEQLSSITYISKTKPDVTGTIPTAETDLYTTSKNFNTGTEQTYYDAISEYVTREVENFASSTLEPLKPENVSKNSNEIFNLTVDEATTLKGTLPNDILSNITLSTLISSPEMDTTNIDVPNTTQGIGMPSLSVDTITIGAIPTVSIKENKHVPDITTDSSTSFDLEFFETQAISDISGPTTASDDFSSTQSNDDATTTKFQNEISTSFTNLHMTSMPSFNMVTVQSTITTDQNTLYTTDDSSKINTVDLISGEYSTTERLESVASTDFLEIRTPEDNDSKSNLDPKDEYNVKTVSPAIFETFTLDKLITHTTSFDGLKTGTREDTQNSLPKTFSVNSKEQTNIPGESTATSVSSLTSSIDLVTNTLDVSTPRSFATTLPMEPSNNETKQSDKKSTIKADLSTSTDNVSSRRKDIDIPAWTDSTSFTELTSTEPNTLTTDTAIDIGCKVNTHCPMDKACMNGTCQNPCEVKQNPCTKNILCKVVNHAAVCVCDDAAGVYCARGMHPLYFAYQ